MTGFEPLAPFAYDFFVRGLLVATLAGALCGLIGVFVVLRSMSYIGHGLAHAVFGGAAVSAAFGWSYFAGAGLWGLLAALVIGRVSARRTISADAAIGVVTTASFAAGLVIQARTVGVSRAFDAVLFGDVIGVFRGDVVAVAVVGALVTTFVVGCRRELTFATFDPDVAAVSGVRVPLIDALLMLAVAATVIVSVRVIGALLVSAMLVLPAASARLATNSIHRMLVLSPLIGAACGLGGMYASWYADVPSGAAITLAGTLVFALAYLTSDISRRRALGRLDEHGAVA
jgi:ABC-type Mn2+/Zn2+ transport system permease subunit